MFIKTTEEIEILKEGGKILAQIMKKLKDRVQPGISTEILENLAQEFILKFKAKPSFLGFENYPKVLCASVNNEIVHALPSKEKILKKGDIISLDLGLLWKGYHADMAITIPVGKIDPETSRLIRITKKALKRGIKKAKVGNTLGDIGNTIERCIEGQKFSVIRQLCGHGIGKELHEEPKILNHGKRGKGEKLKEGMVFCIEPMAAMGKGKIKKSKDGYGWETKDGSLSAHFEHTIVITEKGAEILTI